MKISYLLMLILASLALFVTSCDDDNNGHKSKDKCENVTCKENEVCDKGTGKCVALTECTKDADCPSGQVCNKQKNVCEEKVDLCAGNTCASEGKVCDPNTGLCIDLNVDELDTIVKARKWSSQYGTQNGIALTKKLEGVVVGIRGLKTSSHHAIIIQQAGATEFAAVWVNLDNVKDQEGLPEFKVGNLVKVKGNLYEYWERTQIAPQSLEDIEIVNETVELPAAIDISSVEYDEKYESMYVNLTNVPFTVTDLVNIVRCDENGGCPTGTCSGTICPQDSKFTYTAKDSNEKTIEIGTLLSYPRVEFTMNEKITAIKGVMTIDHDLIVIFPTSQSDVVSDGSLCGGVQCGENQICVDEQCVDKADENTNEACSDGVDNDGDGYADCEDFDCSRNPDVTVCGGGNECDPACGDGQVCVDGTCQDVQSMTVSQVRAGTVGEVYTTSGIITAVDNKGFYFQDNEAGLYVYMGSEPAVTAGNNVTVTGKLDEYHGFMELKDANVQEGDAATMPASISIAGNEMSEAHESMYVSLTGQPFTITEIGQYDLTVTDTNANSFLLKKTPLTADLTVGAVLSKLDGVVSQYDNNYRLVLRVAEDMETVTFNCDPACQDWEVCSAENTCTLKPGMCADDNDCQNGETCGADHVCATPAPVCNPACDDWKECTADNTCTLKPGMCDTVDDCNNGATSCENHVCIGGTAPQFPNADFSAWDNETTPANWKIGNSGLTLAKTPRDNDFALSAVGTPPGNKYLISTALTAMTDTRPSSITFEAKGTAKMSINIACDLNDDGYTSGEQKAYNLPATDSSSTTFTNSGNNAYITFTANDWTTYTIQTGDELVDFWKAGVKCRVEFKVGKNQESNIMLDNIVINY